MSGTIESERDGALRILTLNRPERHNAMDDEMSALFRAALDEALEESGSNAILIRANGKSFCSGRDTTVLGQRAREESDFHFIRRHQEGRLKIQEATKPIIAALKGGAIGGGCELALAADTSVSDKTAALE